MTEPRPRGGLPLDPPAPEPPPRRSRGRLWRALAAAGLGLLGGLAAIILALQNPAVATRVANQVMARVPSLPGARISVREVRGGWLADLEARGLRIARGDTTLVAADTVRARYRLLALLAGRVRVTRLELSGVTVSAEIAEPRGPRPHRAPLTLAAVMRGRFYEGPALVADRVVLRGGRYGGYAAAPDSGWRATDVTLAARDVRLGGGFSFTLDSLDLRLLPTSSAEPLAHVTLAGGLADGRAELSALRARSAASDIFADGALAVDSLDTLREIRVALKAHPLALGDLRRLAPGLDLEGDLAADVEARGPRPDRLSGRVRAELGPARAGRLRLGPSSLRAELRDGRADLALTTGYEGAQIEAHGWVRPLDADPEYDVVLRLDRLPRRLPGIVGWEAVAERVPVTADLRVRGRGYAGTVLNVQGGARGPAGNVTLDGRLDASRGFEWEVRRLAFEGLDLARLAGDTTASAFTGALTGRGSGASLDSLRAIADLRLAPSHYGPWRISSVAARARAEGPAVGLSFSLDSEAGALSVAAASARLGGRSPFHIHGVRFDHLDLSRLTGDRELTSDLSGNAEIEGSARPPLAATGSAVLEPSRLRGRVITGGSAELAYERDVLTLDAELTSDAGRISASASAHPFASPPEYLLHEARFADLDVGAWTGAALPTRLNGRITAAGSASSGGQSRLPDAWQATLRLDRSQVGPLDLEGVEADGRLAAGHAEAKGSVRARGGTASFDGGATWEAGGPGLRGLDGRAALVLPFGVLAGLAGRDTLPADGAVRCDLGFGDPSDRGLSMNGTLAGHGRIGAARVDSLFGTWRFAGGALDVDTLALRTNVGQVAAAGRVALSDSAAGAPSDVRLTATVTDLAPLADLIGADTLGLGAGDLAARLTGPPAARAFTVETSLRSLAWNDLRVLRARAEARGTLAGDWRPVEAHARAELSRLHTPVAEAREIRAGADYAGRELRFELDAGLDEKHRVRLAGTAARDTAGHAVTLATADIDADTAHWRLSRPARLRFGPGRFEISDLEARAQTGLVRAGGVLDRRGEQDFRLEMRDVGLDILAAWLGREDVTGRLDGNLSLAGPAAAPRGEGRLRIAALQAGAPAGVLGSELAWDGRELRLHAAFTSPQDDSLVVEGRLPLAVSLAAPDSGAPRPAVRAFAGDVDLRLAADRFPLRALSPFLPPRAVSAINGTLDADARLAGTGEALTGQGSITISNGYLALPALGVAYQGIRLEGELSGNRLLLREARAASGEGNLQATGEVRFASFTRTELDLAVAARRFSFMDTPDLRAVASGDLRVAGTVDTPRVAGRATIAGSYYFITQAATQSAQAKLAVPLSPADVRMLEENFGYLAPPAANPTLALYEASDLDLQIKLERDTWVRQRSTPRLAVEVTGDVQLRKRPHADPELFGRLQPVPDHGYVEQFGRSFDFTGGEVLFNGGMQDHTVDIRTEYKTRSPSGSGEPEVVVHLDVQGPIDKLRLTLTSEPALSETDIITYIATGRSPTGIQTQSSESSSNAAALAADIGMSQVTGALQDVAQGKVGLDVLQVRYDAQQGATLVAGRYVKPMLYLGFRQPLQYRDTGTTDTSNPYRTRFEVEFETYQWLVFNLQGEIDLLRAFVRARHAY